MADIEVLRECGDGKQKPVFEMFDHPDFESIRDAEKWIEQEYEPEQSNSGRLLVTRVYRDLDVALRQVTQKKIVRNDEPDTVDKTDE